MLFAALVYGVTNAPNWPEVKAAFFDWDKYRESFPIIARAFLLNVKIFMIAEVFILIFALVLAVLRSLPGPVFFPIRALAIAYADFFRGVPTILVIALLGFGAPALAIEGSRPRRPSGESSRSSSSTRHTSPRSTAPESSRCIRARRRRRARWV